MTDHKKPVFLSHSSKDAELVQEVAEYLESNHIPCWYAPRDIPKGDRYYIRIIEDLEQKVNMCIVFITENVGDSKFVPKEIDRALYYDLPIIPIVINQARVPKSLELNLCDLQWIDFSTEGLDKIVETIGEITQENSKDSKKDIQKLSVNEPLVLQNQLRVHLYKVNEYTLNKVKEVYVPFPNMEIAKQILLQESIVHFHHTNQTGKFTSAIALLQSLGIQEIYEWEKETSLKEMVNHRLKSKIGLIIEADELQFFNSFTAHEMEVLIQRLKDKQSFMVFISKSPSSQTMLSSVSVHVSAPENVMDMLFKYIKWSEGNTEVAFKMKEWLNSHESQGVLPELIYPDELNPILKQIKLYVSGEITLHHLKDSFYTKTKVRVQTWFKQNTHISDIAFYLSIGLFEGNPSTFIREKSKLLSQMITQEEGQMLFQKEKHRSKEERFEFFHVIEKRGLRQSDIGTEEIDEMHFKYPEDGHYVWEYVWTQIDDYQLPITNWIFKLMNEGDMSKYLLLNILVHLAKLDFSGVREKIIQPLAKSNHVKQRWFIVHLLEKVAQDKNFAHKVFNLMKSWIGSRNKSLQWTAIILLGKDIGVRHFHQSLNLIQTVFNQNEKQLYYPIKKTMNQLNRAALWGGNYEKIYFQFWKNWFTELEGAQYGVVLRFASGIFLSHPDLFFKSDKHHDFWIKYLNDLYRNPTQNILLEKWAKTALGNEVNEKKLWNLIKHLMKYGASDSKHRIHIFLNQELQKADSPVFLNKYINF
ncbi:toll/interleukin-1 receptor domain-containing protein [Chengkuizengella axinellae]|uniref:Toll/interleukin-1 receptor domain-containing protein n=1 Tax=Chengkuizengella axinellae TaxID=3064388 RepID=A0ABT9J1S1_9BACL|nr:toll/interleukin-1 receptor domain-containing protein [Chengkuizengella sp. 2205SS18-9]MDP5274965.1 toll/interleukin-1 receptor domain-containing protein [Chengkuizengella sp. 2205SS18-9]